MKRLVYLSILLVLVISIWSFGPAIREAKALTKITLISPADSSKVTTTPTFEWTAVPGLNETIRRFNIKLALDPNCTSPFWEDTLDASTTSKVYDGDPLTGWQTYYWTVGVELDSIGETGTITYWQEETATPSTFFYTTATLFHIPDSLPTIQEGIVWAAPGDTVLVEPGVYYENLWFYKRNLLVTSKYLSNQDTATINKTIIDGSDLTRGEKNGSVVYFSSGVDSSSTLMGFTIRGGMGSEVEIGANKRTNGGGIFCDVGSTPTIANNVITENRAEHDGGGIFIYSAAPNILHNIITNNFTVKGSGGAIQCYRSIKVGASPGLSPDDQNEENKEKASLEKSRSDSEIKKSLSSPKSRSKMSEGEIKNSLNPRDATDVSSAQNNPPVAKCSDDPVYGDTLTGFTTSDEPHTASDTMTLDACLSYDPDPDDSVESYLWEPVSRTFPVKGGYLEVGFWTSTDPTKCIQKFTSNRAGLLKFRLRVKDSYGLESENYDSVFFSIQYPPVADAGSDTILLPKAKAVLSGGAFEINPDQRSSLRYNWTVISSPFDLTPQPSDTAQSIYFFANLSGIYKLQLIVMDDYFALSPPDTVNVVANELPKAAAVDTAAFEGDTVYLDASASYDPDSATFKDPNDTTAWLNFTWSVKSKPPHAETPAIVGADRPIAKFVPYGTGTYEFQVLVNDRLSKDQPPDEAVNIAVLTVTIDSTYAYPIIQGNLVSHNFSASRGGGIDCNNSSPDIINNIFYKNQSELSGGGISCRNLSTPQIKSNIFFGNISSNSTGGAIADLKVQLSPSATRGFRKNLAIQYNDFWDNWGGTLYQTSGDISNNIYDFPRLIDPDFGNFTLECSSPCYPDIGSLIYFDTCVTVKRLELISLSLFQNPVATAVAHFIVNTDVPLKALPVAYVTIGDYAPSPVYFVPISSKTYRGSFVFTVSGIADISVFASSLVERDTIAVDTFSVALIEAGKAAKLVSSDKKVEVLFPQGSVKEGIYATCISVSKDSRYQFEEQPEVVAFGEAYQLGPTISFDKDLMISFPLSHLDVEGIDKTLFTVYKHADGEWDQIESFLDGNSVCAKVNGLGVYRLIYDPKGKHIAGIPKTHQLFQNYPNPFNPETQIKYDLPVSGHVELTIYNILGQKVKVLVDEIQDAGHKSVMWDGKDDEGREVASGIYFYKITAESFKKTKKMVLLK